MSLLVTGVTAIILSSVSGLGAQEPRNIRTGDRVRVTLASRIAPAPLVGMVIEIDPDTLTIEREEGGLRRLSRIQIESIEVSVRRELETGEAAGYGILAAAPLLVLLAIALPIVAAEAGGAAWSILGAAVGGSMLVGALIGGTTPQDTWVEARWPAIGQPGDSIPIPAGSIEPDTDGEGG